MKAFFYLFKLMPWKFKYFFKKKYLEENFILNFISNLFNVDFGFLLPSVSEEPCQNKIIPIFFHSSWIKIDKNNIKWY